MAAPRPHISPPDTQPATCVFSDTHLDRLNNLRHSPSLLTAALPPHSLYLIFSHNLHVLFRHSRLHLLPEQRLPLPPHHRNPHPTLFLGVSHQSRTAFFAIRLPQTFDAPAYTRRNPPTAFLHLRPALAHLPPHQAALAAHARSLFEFHQRHAYCGICASPTRPDHFGARRTCKRNTQNTEPHTVNPAPTSPRTPCNGVWFPRSDPVVIMLVLNPAQDRVLLARSARHPKSFYSCLAGFMEHAEGIDQAVRREVMEESAIKISRVRFFASQPWPFPYSLMLGCIALAENEHISIDSNELEDARWFDRAQVADMVRRGRHPKDEHHDSQLLAVPPPTAIAGVMCAAFAESQPIASFPPSSTPPSSGAL